MQRALAFPWFSALFLVLILTGAKPVGATHLDFTLWDLTGTFSFSSRVVNIDLTSFSGTLTFAPDRTFSLEGAAIGLPIMGAWFDKGKRGYVLFDSNVLEVVQAMEGSLELLIGHVRIDLKTVTMTGKVSKGGNRIRGTTVIKGTLHVVGRTAPFTMKQKYTGTRVR